MPITFSAIQLSTSSSCPLICSRVVGTQPSTGPKVTRPKTKQNCPLNWLTSLHPVINTTTIMSNIYTTVTSTLYFSFKICKEVVFLQSYFNHSQLFGCLLLAWLLSWKRSPSSLAVPPFCQFSFDQTHSHLLVSSKQKVISNKGVV